jgi:aldose 1-epimerase
MADQTGTLADGTPVERYVLSSPVLEVAVLTYGGIVQSLHAPDREGRRDDVVLGFDDVRRYQQASPYFGALIGRYANRIANGRFDLNGRTYQLPVNNGPNTLHGGTEGFDKKVWDAQELTDAAAVRLSLTSPDGDQGFPGRLDVTVTYSLDGDSLRIDYEARNAEPEGGLETVLNLTNHSYFNLAGEGSGSVEAQELQVRAGQYLPVSSTSIPLGAPAPVEGTPLDFRTPTAIGARWREGDDQLANVGGYDHNLVLDGSAGGSAGGAAEHDGLPLAAVAHDPGSGRVLEVFTDQPGVQFYSGNQLLGTLRGKSGRLYRQGDAFCLETQHWPDSPNHPDYPTTVLRPQETFRTSTVWRFTTR